MLLTHGPSVSVYSTVRNGERFLPQMMESLLRQTLRDWELVIVDDGSTDATEKILRGYAADDQRIRLIVSPKRGRGHALNLAVREATAPLIANIDADDVLHPQRLQIQLDVLREQRDLDVVGSRYEVLHEDAAWDAEWLDLTAQPLANEVGTQLCYVNPICHSSAMIRRAAVLDAGGYAVDRDSQFDYELWVRLGEMGCRIGRIEVALVGKRMHSAQSFMARSHFRYVKSSAQVQWRAIRAAGFPVAAVCAWALRFPWALAPRQLRTAFRRMLTGRFYLGGAEAP